MRTPWCVWVRHHFTWKAQKPAHSAIRPFFPLELNRSQFSLIHFLQLNTLKPATVHHLSMFLKVTQIPQRKDRCFVKPAMSFVIFSEWVNRRSQGFTVKHGSVYRKSRNQRWSLSDLWGFDRWWVPKEMCNLSISIEIYIYVITFVI